jgi:anthranilate synthase
MPNWSSAPRRASAWRPVRGGAGADLLRALRGRPSEISRRLKAINPSPYSFFINLGNQEFLVGASPEMFVRVNGRRIETCPISGTIKRGEDAIADSEQILKLLNSKKDESELTMCSDVDRNDKSRVCEPGSVKVIGRRQIEMYSRLIHTVDHIEGRLRDGMDAFDGFLSHAWAVTVTGAPKLWAMRFLENNEKSPRAWYGGAIGMVKFQWRHEHRPDASHHPHQGRHCRSAGRGDALV